MSRTLVWEDSQTGARVPYRQDIEQSYALDMGALADGIEEGEQVWMPYEGGERARQRALRERAQRASWLPWVVVAGVGAAGAWWWWRKK